MNVLIYMHNTQNFINNNSAISNTSLVCIHVQTCNARYMSRSYHCELILLFLTRVTPVFNDLIIMYITYHHVPLIISILPLQCESSLSAKNTSSTYFFFFFASQIASAIKDQGLSQLFIFILFRLIFIINLVFGLIIFFPSTCRNPQTHCIKLNRLPPITGVQPNYIISNVKKKKWRYQNQCLLL